jgi:predicted RNA polymerase sigma factor
MLQKDNAVCNSAKLNTATQGRNAYPRSLIVADKDSIIIAVPASQDNTATDNALRLLFIAHYCDIYCKRRIANALSLLLCLNKYRRERLMRHAKERKRGEETETKRSSRRLNWSTVK